MKKYFPGLLLAVTSVVSLAGCRETSKLPEPAIESLPLIIPQYSSNEDRTYYEIATSRLNQNSAVSQGVARPIFEFVINPDNNRSVKIKTVEVYKSFGIPVGAPPIVNPTTPSPAPLGLTFDYGPRVKAGEYSSFPATVSFDSRTAISDLPFFPAGLGGNTQFVGPANTPAGNALNANDVVFRRAIIFTFEYILEDGRRIVLTPLDVRGRITGTFANAPYAAVAVFRPAR